MKDTQEGIKIKIILFLEKLFSKIDILNDIKLPNIVIQDKSNYNYASWQESTYCLLLRNNIFYDYSWEDVEYIIKHEIAHLIVSSVWKLKDNKMHGNLFKKACEILNISHRASVSLEKKLDEKILTRAKKLLSLSSSDNEHEAKLALKKANEILGNYTIKEEEVRYSCYVVGKMMKKVPSYYWTLVNFIAEQYSIVSILVFRSREDGKQFEFYGKINNLAIANYVFNYLVFQGEILYANFKKTSNLKHKKHIFLQGVYQGFKDSFKSSANENFNLMTIDRSLQQYIQKHNSNIRTRKMKTFLDPKIYNKGYKKGKKIKIIQNNQDNKKNYFLK